MLRFSSLCDHTQQLHDFLEQHYVLMQTWWCGRCGEVSSVDYARFSFVCFRRYSHRHARRCSHSWRCVLVTVHGQRLVPVIALIQYYTTSWVGYGSAVRVSASYSIVTALRLLIFMCPNESSWNLRSRGTKVPRSECSMERKFHGSESRVV